VPHFLILDHFLFATLSSSSLSVLRVLTRQTLEINTEGEISLLSWSKFGQGVERFHPHHSIQIRSFSAIIPEGGCTIGGFYAGRAHCSTLRSSIWPLVVGSGRDLDLEHFPSLEQPFLALLWVFFLHNYILSELGEFPEGGRTWG
jgi:hypothetical protein